MTPDKSIIWWYNPGEQRYDLANKKYCDASVRIEGTNLVIKGYGWDVEPDTEIYVDIETGAIFRENT